MGVALLSTMAAQGLRERMTSSLARRIAANIAKLPELKSFSAMIAGNYMRHVCDRKR
jgi:hypothetical protein